MKHLTETLNRLRGVLVEQQKTIVSQRASISDLVEKAQQAIVNRDAWRKAVDDRDAAIARLVEENKALRIELDQRGVPDEAVAVLADLERLLGVPQASSTQAQRAHDEAPEAATAGAPA